MILKNNFPEDLDRFKFLSILIHDHIRIFPNYTFFAIQITRCRYIFVDAYSYCLKEWSYFFLLKHILHSCLTTIRLKHFHWYSETFNKFLNIDSKWFLIFFYDSMLKIIFIILRLVKTLHSCKTAEIHK